MEKAWKRKGIVNEGGRERRSKKRGHGKTGQIWKKESDQQNGKGEEMIRNGAKRRKRRRERGMKGREKGMKGKGEGKREISMKGKRDAGKEIKD